jgi:uncharacterized membrane protein
MNFVIIIFCCVMYALLNSAGASIIKSQLQTVPLVSIRSYIQILLNVKVIGGFSLIFVSALVLFKALSLGKFSLIGPMSNGINFICTITIGYFFFHDRLSVYQIFGLFLIITGILFISFNGNK